MRVVRFIRAKGNFVGLILALFLPLSFSRATTEATPAASGVAALAKHNGPNTAGAQSLAEAIAAAIREQAKLSSDDSASADNFGYTVSLSGNRALVGADSTNDHGMSSGSAYIFVFDGTSWTQEAKLQPTDGGAGDLFGISVSLSGNRALVGAAFDSDIATRNGSAYVFVFDGANWIEEAKLTPSDKGADLFGTAVSLSGKHAAIGAPNGNHQKGQVYVFSLNHGTWTSTAILAAADGVTGDNLGGSVSLSGNRVLAGTGAGNAAYVFTIDGNEEAKLTPSLPDDLFGNAVSLSGERALISAIASSDLTGAAYTFAFDGATWNEEARLSASDGGPQDGFGYAVALVGQQALIGAPYVNESSGAAYLFKFNGTSWNQLATLTASDDQPFEYFGISVSISGNRFLIGTLVDRDNETLSGAAYIFGR